MKPFLVHMYMYFKKYIKYIINILRLGYFIIKAMNDA